MLRRSAIVVSDHVNCWNNDELGGTAAAPSRASTDPTLVEPVLPAFQP
jgi:hypothetical protein